MKKFLKNKVLILILLLVAIAAALAWKYNDRQQPKTTETEKRADILPLPKDFPVDLAIGADKDLTFNSEIDIKEGKVYTRRFNTEKPPQESYSFYKQYITEQGWKIVQDKDTQEVIFLFSQKDKNILSFTFNKVPQEGKYWVNISYTYNRPSATSTPK